MCTVTFIPKPNNDFILTSNRDEARGRATFPPEIYEEDGVILLYPKDSVAGGTWIAVSGTGRAATLMNGGFVPHQRKPFYRRSRGLVLKDLLKRDSLKKEVENYDFFGIEPFTAIFVEWKATLQLFQLVWDGLNYHFYEETLIPKIWSSSPLYPKPLQKKRTQWFTDFLRKNANPSVAEMLHFHKTSGEGDLNSNLIMDRGFIRTKSITQIMRSEHKIEMRYEDLQAARIYKRVF